MAARMKKFHQDDVRAKIQASQLINRLTDHALGIIELKSEQVRSIDILLKKALPDLQSVSIEGAGENGEHILAVEWRVKDAGN